MDPRYVVFVREAGLELEDALDVQYALLQDLVLGVEQPLLALRVVGEISQSYAGKKMTLSACSP